MIKGDKIARMYFNCLRAKKKDFAHSKKVAKWSLRFSKKIDQALKDTGMTYIELVKHKYDIDEKDMKQKDNKYDVEYWSSVLEKTRKLKLESKKKHKRKPRKN